MNHLSLNMDDTMAHFASLRDDASKLGDDFAAGSTDFSDEVLGLVHVDATRRLKAALGALHDRNIKLAQGLSDVCAAGMKQVSAFQVTEEGNASGIAVINDDIDGGEK